MSYSLSFVLCGPSGIPQGEFIDADQRLLQRRLNVPGVATCTTLLESKVAALVLPGQSRLKIYRSPSAAELSVNPSAPRVMLWYGSLPADGVQEDTTTGFMTCNFQDPRWVLRDRYIATPFNQGSNDISVIFASMLSDQNLASNTWLTANAIAAGTGNVWPQYDPGKNVAQAWDEATQANLCDIDVIPSDGYTLSGTRAMGSVRWFGTQGADRPNTLFTYIGNGNGNMTGIRSTYAPIYNTIYAQGVDYLGNFWQSTAVGTLGNMGQLTQWLTVGDPWQAVQLDAYTSGLLAQNGQLRRIIEAGESTWEAPQPFTDYDLGDTVRLTAQRGTLQISQAKFRVMGYDISPDQEGNVVSQVVLV